MSGAAAAAAAAAPTAQQVKELRESTGAGVMECKRALAESGGDLDKAKAWLKERSRAAAANKASRTAEAGLVGAARAADGYRGALAVVRTETDFVARNADFQGLARALADKMLKGQQPTPEDVVDVAGKVRENVVLGESAALSVPPQPGNAVGVYLHNKLADGVGTIGALVALTGVKDAAKAAEMAQTVAMHVVAANPAYVSRDNVPAAVRAEEEAKAAEDPKLADKPAKAKEAAIRGKLQKFYAESCLLEQSFLMGDLEGKPLKGFLGSATVAGMARFQIGGR